ncbi:MAG TPA: divalent metal cation transporter, partial [Gemmatimonadaceae bacterium]
MKKWGEVALGIVTSIGGFLEVGSIATSAQGGAEFGYQLAWVLVLGILSLAILMEMTGRLAAVSKRSYGDLLRERFGYRFFLLPFMAVFVVSLLVLMSEIGGVSIALQIATGIEFRWWAIPTALVGWILLWRGTFSIVEQGTALLGLAALSFGVGALVLHPSWPTLGRALLPSLPSHDHARYWYLAVSMLGASISPYLYLFYSAGAIEDEWTIDYLAVNRITAGAGNVFGGGLAIAVLVIAALVFAPRQIQVDAYEQIALLLATPLGRTGFVLFIVTLFITCFGATLEIVLAMAYILAQGFGWRWSENLKPGQDARFSTSYTVLILFAALPIAVGMDPLSLTNISMVATAASLPVTVIPLFVLMNDGDLLNANVNGWASNLALVVIALLSIVLLVAALPLD